VLPNPSAGCPDPAHAFSQNLNSPPGGTLKAIKVSPLPPSSHPRRPPDDDAAGGGRPRTAAHPATHSPRSRGRRASDAAIAAAGVPARLQRRPARARPRRCPRGVRPPPLPCRLACAALGGPAAQPPQPRPGHGPLPQLHQARIRERMRFLPFAEP
jgi:hypothetical protein